MKKMLPLLLALLVGFASTANAQSKPKKSRHAFAHSSEAGKSKADKTHFRSQSKRPVIDLTPHSQTNFKTAKANKPYKFSKGNGFAKGK